MYDPQQNQRKKEEEDRQMAVAMKESLEAEGEQKPEGEKNLFGKSKPSFIKEASEKLKKK